MELRFSRGFRLLAPHPRDFFLVEAHLPWKSCRMGIILIIVSGHKDHFSSRIPVTSPWPHAATTLPSKHRWHSAERLAPSLCHFVFPPHDPGRSLLLNQVYTGTRQKASQVDGFSTSMASASDPLWAHGRTGRGAGAMCRTSRSPARAGRSMRAAGKRGTSPTGSRRAAERPKRHRIAERCDEGGMGADRCSQIPRGRTSMSSAPTHPLS
jgi:hypothetical protein